MFYLTNENSNEYDISQISKKSKIWSLDHKDTLGELLITFDKVKVYNLWCDFPNQFSQEEIKILKKEMPYWYDFFKERLK